MKWAQFKKRLDDDGVLDKNERKKLFREYKTKKALEEDLKLSYVVWATYPDDDPLQKTFSLNRKGQRKYELFCGGFLYYHDVEFKKYPTGDDGNLVFEHTVYFEWLPKEKGEAKTHVKIYVNPTPPEFNPNPPKPPPPPPPESND